MIVGYARTSTREQVAGFEAQKRELLDAGVEKIFEEQVSAVAQRERLKAAIEFCRESDTLVVTKLDRLARSVMHLTEIIGELKRKKVQLKILNIGVDTNTATGELMLNVIGSVAQFERQMMLERQLDGIAAAKAAGKYKGRKPTARMKSAEVHAMARDGIRPGDIANRLGIGRMSVWRILRTEAAA